MTDTKKMTRTRKQAADAKDTASTKEMIRENNERVNARLRALLLSHFPSVPLPSLVPMSLAVQQYFLVCTSASTSFARQGLPLNTSKPIGECTEEEAALRRRFDRNGRLLVRLVFLGLVRRGEIKSVNVKKDSINADR